MGVRCPTMNGRDTTTPEDLTTADVARRLGVSPITVRLWCRRGLFKNAYEREESRGSVWIIPEKDLDGFEPPKRTGRPPKAKANAAPKAEEKRPRKARRPARS